MKERNVDPCVGIWRALSLIVFAVAISASLNGQPNAPGSDESSSSRASSSAATAVSQNEPLTFKDRLTDYQYSTFHPTALAFPAAEAGYEQLTNYPSEWQQGAEGYGKRLASAYGSLVVGNTIKFGFAAVDREDLNYVPSTYPRKSIFKRAGYAIGHAFVSNREGGGHSFAWARFAGDAGAGFIANEWYPARHSNLHNAAYLSTFNFLGDIGGNLAREFIRPSFIFGPKRKNSKP